MIGYKGFDKGLVCRGEQYEVGEVFEEPEANARKSGMCFCKLPHQVFEHYSAGEGHEFAEVEALADVQTYDEKKYCTKKLKIVRKMSVKEICETAAEKFMEAFGFEEKIEKAKASGAVNAGHYGTANVGNWGAANAGNCGAANAGYYGAANAGHWGAANTGHYGAANAGDYGAANAGNCGAANAGNGGAANAGYRGAANAGNRGAANAGDCGASIVRANGCSSVGKGGVAVAFDGMAKGALGAVIVLVETDENLNVVQAKSYLVDGEKVKADTYYTLKNGRRTEIK